MRAEGLDAVLRRSDQLPIQITHRQAELGNQIEADVLETRPFGATVAQRDDRLDHLLHRLDLVGRQAEPVRTSAPSLITAARGSTVLMRTPRPASSAASALVMRFRAAFDAP